MNKPKNQHIVPNFYLDGFTDSEGHLFAYEKEKNKFIEPYVNPDKFLREMHFYSWKNADGSWNYELEKHLSMIENAAKPIFEKLTNDLDAQLTEYETESLLAFFSFLYVRTPKFRNIIDRLIPDNAWESFGFERDIKRVSFAVMEDSVKSVRDILKEMNWRLYRIPKDRKLLCSDAPFTTLNLDNRIVGTVNNIVSIGLPQVINIIPLNQTHCLLLSRMKILPPKLRGNIIREINTAIYHGANRFIFSSSKRLIERIIK